MFAAVNESDLPHSYNFCTKVGVGGTTRALFHFLFPEDLWEVIAKFNFCDRTGEWPSVTGI